MFEPPSPASCELGGNPPPDLPACSLANVSKLVLGRPLLRDLLWLEGALQGGCDLYAWAAAAALCALAA